MVSKFVFEVRFTRQFRLTRSLRLMSQVGTLQSLYTELPMLEVSSFNSSDTTLSLNGGIIAPSDGDDDDDGDGDVGSIPCNLIKRFNPFCFADGFVGGYTASSVPMPEAYAKKRLERRKQRQQAHGYLLDAIFFVFRAVEIPSV